MTRPIPYRVLLSLLTVLLLSVPAFAAEPFGHDDNAGVTVMTRNMYFGADLTPALVATTPFDFIAAVTSIFGIVNASDVANRIDRMAEEIARTKPDLVGLQEVAIWRTQFPPDFSPTPNATAVVYDFLALLLARLEALGARYDVVATHVTNDLEAPAFFPGFACCFEVRFTDQEVILARANHGLNLSNVQDGTFATQVFFTVPGAPAPYVEKRGWLSVDVKKGNDQFRFITTHLLPEGFFDPAQVGQGFELLTGPANTSGNVILVCDCNSRADNTGTATYGLLLGAGFGDVWSARHPADPGFSCCQAENLLNPVSALDQRIDLILFRGAAQVEAVALTGASPGDQTAAGRWPSDHAGVVGTVDFRR